MRPLTYYVAVTLDGFIAAPDGDFSMFATDGDHMAAQLRDYADALPAPALTALGLKPDGSRFDAVVMGWNTYAVGLPAGLTNPYPHLDTHVFSRSQASRDGAVTVTDADPRAVVRDLKRQAGSGIWLCGGGRLASALLPEIDALVLKVHPIVLGQGIPLFAPGAGTAAGSAVGRRFALASSTAFRSGVIISEYARAEVSEVRPGE